MVAQATLNKQANALITLFINEYTNKWKHAPQLNRYKEKWGFLSMIEDLGYERAQEVVKYYLTTPRPGHPVQYLLFNYEKFDARIREFEEDAKERERLRQETAKRVREWSAGGDE